MSHFSKDSLQFLRGLKRNNKKPWFEAHRADHETHIKQPMADLVTEMDIRLARIAPELMGEPKRSMFRIHRDVRFSSDKSPYKTHAACWFFHSEGSSKVGREAHGGGAGLYFHLEPGASLVGGGIWMPPRPALQRIRAAIAADAKAFERVLLAPALRKRMGAMSEESMLKRLPRGVEEGSAGAKWMRYQSFTLGRSLTDAQVVSSRLTATLADDFARLVPLVRWLNAALGLRAASRR